jgi:hypothetical protein
MSTKEITYEQAMKLAAIMTKNTARIGVPKIVKK